MHRSLALCLGLATTICAIDAHALAPDLAPNDDLTVTTREYGAWPESIAALQADRSSEQRVLHVFVTDGARELRCGEYSLSLTVAAFSVGACDPTDSTTPLTLVRRDALFDHGDIVAHPLTAGIAVVAMRTGGSTGGAADSGGSEVNCSAWVRPYMRDLESGRQVFLQPGRFVLRTVQHGVTVQSDPTGWTLNGQSGSVRVEYEVEDTQRHRIVTRDAATLTCQVASARAEEIVPAAERQIIQSVVTASHAPVTARPRSIIDGVGTVGTVLLPLGLVNMVSGVALLALMSGDSGYGHDERMALSYGVLGTGAGMTLAGVTTMLASSSPRARRGAGGTMVAVGTLASVAGLVGMFLTSYDQTPGSDLRGYLADGVAAGGSAMVIAGVATLTATHGDAQSARARARAGVRFNTASISPTGNGGAMLGASMVF